MTRKRVDNWKPALINALSGLSKLPFAYDPAQGADCIRLANTAATAMTGKPLFKDVRYTTLKAALRTMKKRGYDDLRDALNKHPELKRIHVSHCQCGDFGAVKVENTWTVVVHDGQRFIGMGGIGLMHIPVRFVRSIYRL